MIGNARRRKPHNDPLREGEESDRNTPGREVIDNL